MSERVKEREEALLSVKKKKRIKVVTTEHSVAFYR